MRYTRSEIGNILKKGGIGVLATDTLYGVVGSALHRKTVERIFVVRKRNPKKPFIILIASVENLATFGIAPDAQTKRLLEKLWPGKVSVLLMCKSKRYAYLHRGTKMLAFRIPAEKKLRTLIARTGPLVAPSANPEGLPPAKNIKEAQKYFGEGVDFYESSGGRNSAPSTLVAIKGEEIEVLREGAVDIQKILNK